MSEHEHGHPDSYLNAIEVSWLAADSKVMLCPHCTATTKMLPMSGTAWGLDVHHEADCPDHEDNQPATGHDFTNDE